MMREGMAPPDEDARLLCAAVREAGALALDYFRRGLEVRRWEKNPGDPVSDADMAVDRLLQERLTKARPDYGWLSEETPDDGARIGRNKLWVVDPIDGTRAFLAGRPQFTVCAALVAGDAAVAAAVYNPASDEFFEAVAGGGARCNGQPIRTSRHEGLAGASLLASKRTFEQRDWAKSLPGARFTDMNSIAYRMVKAAAGAYDAAVSTSPKRDWDIAAADLIVREAGGACTTMAGALFRYNRPEALHPSVLAAGPALHAALCDLLRPGSA